MSGQIATKKHICKTPEETFRLGFKIGQLLSGGEVIMLSGGLGAGKTLITKGIVSALGFDQDDVNSPSFTLVNIYPTEKFKVYHVDLWRVVRENDPSIGLEEILDDEESVIIIEWADKLKSLPISSRKKIYIKVEGEGDEARRIFVDRS